MFYPVLEDLPSLAKKRERIPLSLCWTEDTTTPIDLFQRLRTGEYCFLLESSLTYQGNGRYSFMGFNPYLILKARGNWVGLFVPKGFEQQMNQLFNKIQQTIKTLQDSFGAVQKSNGSSYSETVMEQEQRGQSELSRTQGMITPQGYQCSLLIEGHPPKIIEQVMNSFYYLPLPGMPDFSGGAVGYFGYEAARYSEPLLERPDKDTDPDRICLMFVDDLLVFDHDKQKITLITHFFCSQDEKGLEDNYQRARKHLLQRQTVLQKAKRSPILRAEKLSTDKPLPEKIESAERDTRVCPSLDVKMSVEEGLSELEYVDKVKEAQNYIRQGDIFQVVLARQLKVTKIPEAFAIYRRLRLLNPSPYMYYLQFDDFQVVGASPETLVKVSGNRVLTCPIAGTRPRGKDREQDQLLGEELLADSKEKAEHMMLVDLGRNDLGKLCNFGTVKVSRLAYLQYFSHVIHMTSDVEGELRTELSALDALMAVLPAGTLSGAPKIRAMEIIDSLEPVSRGLYGGAVTYLGYDGNVDSCIIIRTAVCKAGVAYVGAGAGIVQDSQPQNEFLETRAKAGAILRAIREAEAENDFDN